MIMMRWDIQPYCRVEKYRITSNNIVVFPLKLVDKKNGCVNLRNKAIRTVFSRILYNTIINFNKENE